MTIFQIQLNLPSTLETEKTKRATSNTEIYITNSNSNSNYVKKISVRKSQAIVIRDISKLTLSRKTSANVLKFDASKKGIQPGKL